jgi:Fuc2NAc and GlcNAc transferase
MITGLAVFLASCVAIASWAGVALVRSYATRRLLDVPNDRSSHARPTPRGGGLALTVAHVLGVLVASLLGLLPPDLAAALIGGGSLVAIIGFLDDHGDVNPSLRLACHFLAFIWASWWLGGLPQVDFGWGPTGLGWAGTVLMLLYLAWFLNLFNFMDGIDGIAAAQSISMSGTASLLLLWPAAAPGAVLPLLMLAAATAGFLVWNWPPARIFMGDVGSGYLGYALGVLALWTIVEGWLTPWVWLILGGAFLADATVTLLVRATARMPIVDAHRSHAYQRLSRHLHGHRPVTLLFVGINILWLGPWAAVASYSPRYGAAFATLALAPLFFAAARLGAGRPDSNGP